MKPNRTREEILLLSKLQQGDKKAFNALFRKYYPTLCAYAHRFVDLEDAEEIVQDVMLWLWENREILLIESSLSQYLLKMIYHRALNRIAQKEVKYRADTLFYEKKSGNDLRCRLLSDRRINKTDSHSHSSVTGILSRSIYHAPLQGYELQRNCRAP